MAKFQPDFVSNIISNMYLQQCVIKYSEILEGFCIVSSDKMLIGFYS